jgi:hypothetical protein
LVALSALPTDIAELTSVIDRHPSGDNRGVPNRFIAVGDLLRSSLAPGPLRAAAFGVLANTSGLILDPSAHDGLNRPAIKVTRTEGEWSDSLYLDPDTSRVLQEETQHNGTLNSRAIVLETGPVDSLPHLPQCPNSVVTVGPVGPNGDVTIIGREGS